MKKIMAFLFTLTFILGLTGCSPQGTSSGAATSVGPGSAPDPGAYKDGVYDVKQKSTKPGYEEALVTIKDGKIESIDLKRLDQNEKEINYDDWDGTKGGYPNLKQYRVDLAKAMLAKKSPDVDAISGATASSNGWKAAVANALSRAK